MFILLETEARELVNKECLKFGEGDVCQIKFAEGRCDVCAVLRLARQKTNSDDIFLVWKNQNGFGIKKILSSHFEKQFLLLVKVQEREKRIIVRISGFGKYSVSLSQLGLES